MQIMLPIVKEFAAKLNEITERTSFFSDSILKDKLPSYLRPGNNFLGKFIIDEVVPYSRIVSE